VNVFAKLKSIEAWASVSPERERLLVILICVALGLTVIASIAVTAIVLLPSTPPAS
jgi:hypothetical protein